MLTAEEVIDITRRFLEKAGVTYPVVESAEEDPARHQWKVVARTSLLPSLPGKELVIDGISGKVLSYRVASGR